MKNEVYEDDIYFCVDARCVGFGTTNSPASNSN